MIILILFSVLGGSFLIWMIFPYLDLIILRFCLKIFTLIICFIGIGFGLILFKIFYLFYINFNFIKLIYFFFYIWFIPIIFCYYLNLIFINLINKYKLFLDLGWIEFIGGGFFIIKFYKLFLIFYNKFVFKIFFLLVFIVLLLIF